MKGLGSDISGDSPGLNEKFTYINSYRGSRLYMPSLKGEVSYIGM